MSSALQSCRIGHALEGSVELVEAAPQNRSFPDRVTNSLGICLKLGPSHDVTADGKVLRYPADAVCVRAPGCVWSTAETGPVGFVSIDIAPVLLPEQGLSGSMRFIRAEQLPELRHCLETLRSDAPRLAQQTSVAMLVDAVSKLGLVAPARGRFPDLTRSGLASVRELLETATEDLPSLDALSRAAGVSPFVLVRQFRRRFGMTPYAFGLGLRVERARWMLARGATIAAAAHRLFFADQSHLTRAFKRVIGLPPGTYLRRARERR